jgi:hypothetical protein
MTTYQEEEKVEYEEEIFNVLVIICREGFGSIISATAFLPYLFNQIKSIVLL